MTDAGLSPKLVEFIRSHLPTYALVDALILLSRNATTHWTRQQLTRVLLPIAVSASTAQEYMDRLIRAGILRQESGETIVFDPASDDLRSVIAELNEAYNERPVTLIRIVYGHPSRRGDEGTG